MYKALSTCILCISVFFNVDAQFQIDLETFAEGLNQPLDLVNNGGDRLYIVEKPGVIKMVMPDGQVVAEPFMDITDRVDDGRGEEGLLGLAFSPNYDVNQEFYVNYTNAQGLTVISRFTTLNGDPFTGDPASEQKILQFAQPFSNHNGGDLAFGPDGYLYIASGDGGSAGDPNDNSQTGTTFLGKILRLDVDGQTTYDIPANNPFVGVGTVQDEIWALGVRNPWRMSFDRQTGDFWIGDVGQGNWEEIDFQPASSPGGENYGWRCYEGNHEYNTTGCDPPENYQFPIYEYRNNRVSNGCSVTGGYVYRGMDFPQMQGWYIYADYCSGRFWGLRSSDTTNIDIGDFGSNQFVGFGENAAGELFVSAIQEGKIYRVVIACDLTISASGEDETCPEENDGTAMVTLSDTSADATIQWSTGDTTLMVTDLSPGTYTVRVISGSCDLTETVTIDSSDLPTSCLADTNFATYYCAGDTVWLEACEAPDGYTYEWYQFDALLAETDEPFFPVTESGMYSVSFKGDCPLGASTEILLTFVEAPEQPIITRNMDTLWADVMADTYRWYLDDSLILETDTNYILIVGEGNYAVQGLNEDCAGPVSESFAVIQTSSEDLVFSVLQSVVPNPSQGQVQLTFGPEIKGAFEIYTTKGQLVLKERIRQDVKLDLTKWSNGVYMIYVEGDSGENEVHQLIIAK